VKVSPTQSDEGDDRQAAGRRPVPPPAAARRVVVALRLALLGLAAGGAALALGVALGDRGGARAGAARAAYACPMHPEITAPKRAPCPICGMALEPVTGAAAAPHHGRGAEMGDADLTAVENVRRHRIVDFVRTRSLLPNAREIRGPAWVDGAGTITAVLYDDQIAALAPDEPGSFALGDAPATTFAVRRTADPVIAWDRSTSRIRFRLDGDGGRAAAPPRAGRVGWLEVARKAREVVAVPVAAVLQSPEGPYVLLPAGGAGFEKRPIEIGETFVKQGYAVVLSGLHPHDRVIGRATFFLDADRRMGGKLGGQMDGSGDSGGGTMEAP
jgi:hypothetical protein